MFDNYEEDKVSKPNHWIYATCGLLILIIVICVSFVAIKSGLTISDISPSKIIATSKSVSGEVFIVTKGRETIKLALVEVCAIPEDKILEWVKSKDDKGRLESSKAKAFLEAKRNEQLKNENDIKNAEIKEKRLFEVYMKNSLDSQSFNAYMQAGNHISKLRLDNINKGLE